MNPFVSIVMPAYNASDYISDAIQSVINQTFMNWELLIVNDGSTDSTKNKISYFKDKRLRYFFQKNKGVSAARNLALCKMKGNFFCFLDADDIMPPDSLLSRINIFKIKPDTSFVDGMVISKDENMRKTIRYFVPSFKGYPYNELLKISQKCLFGPSWMIKRETDVTYLFNERMTHAEDLCFYLSISKGKKYDFTTDEVLHYRITEFSAMSDFAGLETGYIQLYDIVKAEHYINWTKLVYLKYKITRIMLLSYLFHKKSPFNALRVFFRYIFL